MTVKAKHVSKHLLHILQRQLLTAHFPVLRCQSNTEGKRGIMATFVALQICGVLCPLVRTSTCTILASAHRSRCSVAWYWMVQWASVACTECDEWHYKLLRLNLTLQRYSNRRPVFSHILYLWTTNVPSCLFIGALLSLPFWSLVLSSLHVCNVCLPMVNMQSIIYRCRPHQIQLQAVFCAAYFSVILGRHTNAPLL